MQQEKIQQLNELNRFAEGIENFWERYEEATAPEKVDKYQAAFNGDGRFESFMVGAVNFCSLIGYYGNSGCRIYARFNSDLARKYFLKAINALARDIFAKMAEFAKEDAAHLYNEAKAELEELTALVESVRAPKAKND